MIEVIIGFGRIKLLTYIKAILIIPNLTTDSAGGRIFFCL